MAGFLDDENDGDGYFGPNNSEPNLFSPDVSFCIGTGQTPFDVTHRFSEDPIWILKKSLPEYHECYFYPLDGSTRRNALHLGRFSDVNTSGKESNKPNVTKIPHYVRCHLTRHVSFVM